VVQLLILFLLSHGEFHSDVLIGGEDSAGQGVGESYVDQKFCMPGHILPGTGEQIGVKPEVPEPIVASLIEGEIPGSQAGVSLVEIEKLDAECTGGFEGLALSVDGNGVDAEAVVPVGKFAEGQAVSCEKLLEAVFRQGLDG